MAATSHFDRIGLEAPYAEVEDLNQYILLGGGDLNGILKSFRQHTYETSEFRDIVDYIKNFNKTVKVLFYGYDFQSPYKVLKNLRAEIKGPQALLAADKKTKLLATQSQGLKL
ncbi:erythromycin esterase family protein [Pedobacter sp. P351]|uniref:erythromycin esterase family protein n=1 Tax=Pedobacter superstes TaxID=3133441 RepID=UPI0030B7773D